jgi:hypothetical protein
VLGIYDLDPPVGGVDGLDTTLLVDDVNRV